MTTPFSGGCACGSIRYVCSRASIAMLNCHCRDCQRSSGAPFASGFIIQVSDTAISGTPKTYSVRAGSGSLTTRSFCAECGSPLFTRGEAAPGVVHPFYHAGQSVEVSAYAGHLDIQCTTLDVF